MGQPGSDVGAQFVVQGQAAGTSVAAEFDPWSDPSHRSDRAFPQRRRAGSRFGGTPGYRSRARLTALHSCQSLGRHTTEETHDGRHHHQGDGLQQPRVMERRGCRRRRACGLHGSQHPTGRGRAPYGEGRRRSHHGLRGRVEDLLRVRGHLTGLFHTPVSAG